MYTLCSANSIGKAVEPEGRDSDVKYMVHWQLTWTKHQ